MDVGKTREHDCMDAGGRAMQEQLPRSGSFAYMEVGTERKLQSPFMLFMVAAIS